MTNALRILILEDDAVIGMHLAELLAAMGHEICAIEITEADAVAAARLHRPDLMIVDARLQVGSGISAVESICRHRYVPHVFITGDIVGVRAIVPAAIVLEKPFRESLLACAIQQAVSATATR